MTTYRLSLPFIVLKFHWLLNQSIGYTIALLRANQIGRITSDFSKDVINRVSPTISKIMVSHSTEVKYIQRYKMRVSHKLFPKTPRTPLYSYKLQRA